MFQLGKTIVSEEILETQFTCDLKACQGACCVEGSGGAPLEEDEVNILKESLPQLEPFLSESGREAIRLQGPALKGSDGDWETPLVNNRECAYATFDNKGVAYCGIEQAFRAKAINWQKPLSCHLYPIRIREYTLFSALNYHRWHICDPACGLGKKLKMPIYRFVKDALIRKFGEDWYLELEQVHRQLPSSSKE